jgi:5-(carboxyamino)imidazole ribonucleotide synthase
LEATAYNIAASLLTSLNYVGVMALEFFYGPEGLMVNEIAPRTHNSGHFSIEACSSSQFDQQLCITAGLPVPATDLVAPGAIMVNLLGLLPVNKEPLESRLKALEAIPRSHLHWYGKQEMPGRKVGHVTVLLEQADSHAREQEAQSVLKQIRELWPNPLN